MAKRAVSLLWILFTILPPVSVQAAWEFKNIECMVLDETFISFEHCYLRSVSRTYKYLSVHVKLLKVPITNVTVGLAFFKKSNGFRPFLYNITIDGCRFMRERKNNIVRFFYEAFVEYTNMNHTCPFSHDIIVDKVPITNLNNVLTNLLPFPHGEYLAITTWMAYNVPRAVVKIFVAFK